jgi:hypothetical protein
MQAKRLTPILNVSDMQQSFDVVREARMEEGLGVGQSAYFWGRLLGRVRDFPVPERSGRPRQKPGQDDLWA